MATASTRLYLIEERINLSITRRSGDGFESHIRPRSLLTLTPRRSDRLDYGKAQVDPASLLAR